jgi:hypothetical protein
MNDPRLKPPDCLSGGVDGRDSGVEAAWGIDRRVATAAVEEAVLVAVGVLIIPDDLSGGIDAVGVGVGGPRNVENCVGAAAIEETVADGVTVFVNPGLSVPRR